MAITREELNIKVTVDFKDGKKIIRDVTANFKELDTAIKETSKTSEALEKVQRKALSSIVKQNEKLQLAIQNVGKSEVERIQNTLKFTEREIKKKLDSVKAGSEVAKELERRLELEKELADTKISDIIQRQNQALAKQEDALRAVNDETEETAGAFTKLGANLITANQALELAEKAFDGLRQVLQFTIASFSQYEEGLIGVVKTADLSAEQTERFSKEILGLSRAIPSTTKELFQISKSAGQLGVEAESITKFTETIARLTSATDLAGEEAAIASSRILGLTRTPTDQIDRFGSSLVELGNNLRANEPEILRTATIIGQGIGTFGAASTSVLALAGASRDLGIRFELAGSAITRSFIEINESISKGGRELQILSKLTGIAGEDFRKAFTEDSVGTFRKFLDGLSQLEQSQVPRALAAIGLEGVEINRVIPTLAKNIDRVNLAFGLAENQFEKNTALIEESNRAFNILASRSKILGNAIDEIGIQLGRVLEPIILSVTNTLVDLVQGFNEFLSRLSPVQMSVEQLANTIINAAGRIASTVAIIIGALNFSSVIKGVNALIKGFASVAKTLVIVGAKALFVAGKFLAIGLAVDLVVQNIGKLDVAFTALIDGMVAGAAKGSASILNFFGFGEDAAKELDKVGEEAFKSFSEGVGELDTSSLDAIVKAIVAFTDETDAAIKGTKDFDNALKNLKVPDLKAPKLPKIDLSGLITTPEDDKTEKQRQNVLNKLAMDNLKIQGDIDKIGMDRISQISHQAKLEIEKNNELIDQLRIKGLIKGEEDEILKSIQAQNDLIAERAEKTVDFETKEEVSLFNTEQIGTIQRTLGEGTAGFASAVSSMAMPLTAFATGANIFLDGIQALIDLVPNLLNKVSGILNSITDLPMVLNKALQGLADALFNFFANFIPNILETLPERLSLILKDIPQAILNGTIEMLNKLPSIIDEMLTTIIEIAPDIVASMISNAPKIALALVEFLIKKGPDIGFSIAKALAIELPLAIIQGLARGLDQILDALTGQLDFGTQVADQVDEMARAITGAGEQLFTVTTLTQEARAADQAKKLRDAIVSAGNQSAGVIEAAWNRLKDWFKNKFGPIVKGAWQFLIEFFEGMGRFISDAWKGIIHYFSKELPGKIAEAWHGIMHFFKEEIGAPIAKAWHGIMHFFGEELPGAVGKAWNGIIKFFKEDIGGFISSAFKGFTDIIQNLPQTFIDAMSGIGDAFKDLFGPAVEGLKEELAKLDPSSMLPKMFSDPGGGPGRVESALGVNIPVVSFAGGGLVPGNPVVSGDSEQNDTVLSLLSPGEIVLSRTQVKELEALVGELPRFAVGGLVGKAVGKVVESTSGNLFDKFKDELWEQTKKAAEQMIFREFATGGMVDQRGFVDPGEFVINKPAVASIGANALNQINKGKMPQGNTTINLNMTFNTTQPIDENVVRSKIMPTVKREIKRASLDGDFVISKRGIRG